MIVFFKFVTGRTAALPAFLIIALFLCSYNAIHSLIFYSFLISYQSISQDGLGIHRIAVLSYCISAVSLNGMYRSSIAAFYDSHMITGSVMIPVEKDDGPWCRNTSATLPFSILSKPVYTSSTKGKLWHDSLLNESCLIGAPGHETGSPFLSLCKSPP